MWSFEIVDYQGPWCIAGDSVHIPRIVESLRMFSGMTWGEIEQAREQHHAQDFDDLSRDAQQRLKEIHQDDAAAYWRLRCGGKERIWGIRDNNVFRVLWWDPNHRVYELANPPAHVHHPQTPAEKERIEKLAVLEQVARLQGEITRLETDLMQEMERCAECHQEKKKLLGEL